MNLSFEFKLIVFFASLSLSCFASYSLKEMTLEEKVGQLLMVHFNGEEANEDAKTLIQDTKVGGIIYYNWSNGLHSPEQIQRLSASLQKLARLNQNPIPLLIAADQEGGVVARLNNGFTTFPGNKALGATSHPHLAQEAALAMGQELQAVGINMNLAPVVDVNSNPRNPVIGVRSFGDQAETVWRFGKKALNGYRQAHIIATLKHFPGYGDIAIDPHEDLPVVHKSKEELEQVELLPFARLASSAEAIMTAHILVPALDTETCATLSEKTLNYLRETIGFRGVIVADSLVMEGVIKKCGTVDEAAIQALKAGCDILILGGKLLVGKQTGFELTVADVQRIHSAIIKAIKTDRVSEARVNQAVERILNLKNRYLISKNLNNLSIDLGTVNNLSFEFKCLISKENLDVALQQPSEAIARGPMPSEERSACCKDSQNEFEDQALKLKTQVNTKAHRIIAQKIASLALKTTKNRSDSIAPIHEKNISIFAPQLLQNSIDQTTLLKIGKSTDSYFFDDLNPAQEEIEIAKKHARGADVLFICSYNAWNNPSQITLIQSLLDMGKPTVLLIMRDPLDASLFPTAHLIFNTFSPTSPSIQAVCDQLDLFRNSIRLDTRGAFSKH